VNIQPHPGIAVKLISVNAINSACYDVIM